jgi:uncharacterized Zn finger protein (UPF0148 family)
MDQDKFDSSKLTINEKEIIRRFFRRREIFDNFLKAETIKIFTCPSCGFPTLKERGEYEICPLCNWKDDYQDNEHADEVWGGPNYKLSLTESRIKIGKTIQKLELALNGHLNIIPQSVFSILNNHKKRIASICKSIPMNADRTHVGWKEWKDAKSELLNELIITNDQLPGEVNSPVSPSEHTVALQICSYG